MFVPFKEKHRQIIISKLEKYVHVETAMWILSHSNYQNADTHRVFKRIKSLSIETLLVTNTKCPQIIQQISCPSFTCLRVLQLAANNIESIDFLNNLDAPQMTHIYLEHNIITNLRSIRRVHFPGLFFLSLYHNKVTSMSALTMSFFPFLKLLSMKGNYCVNSIQPLLKAEFNLQFLNLEGTSIIMIQKKIIFAAYQKKINQGVMLKI